MWIASKHGWFSIVRKEGHFHVRARRKKDLENLKKAAAFKSVKIEEWPGTDYRCRMRLPQDTPAIESIFASLLDSIDYTNFKSMIASNPDQREKIAAYHEVWDEMAEFQGK